MSIPDVMAQYRNCLTDTRTAVMTAPLAQELLVLAALLLDLLRDAFIVDGSPEIKIRPLTEILKIRGACKICSETAL
jgi:hypothetical protein